MKLTLTLTEGEAALLRRGLASHFRGCATDNRELNQRSKEILLAAAGALELRHLTCWVPVFEVRDETCEESLARQMLAKVPAPASVT